MSLDQPTNTPTPPPRGWRAFLIKLLQGTIALLESAITQLEQPGEIALGRTYTQALGKIREILPPRVNEKLPDWGLSGAIATLAILFFWTTSSLLFPAPAPREISQPVAVLPSPAVAGTPEVSPSPEVPNLETPISESPGAEIPITETPIAENQPSPELPPELAPELNSEPTPEPIPELSPEQALIAELQTQVTEINGTDGLITVIKPKFSGSRLQVQVSQDWYSLKPEEQDRIAAGIEERSQDLDFRQLLVTDGAGNLVARRAVVGKGMIILRRVLV